MKERERCCEGVFLILLCVSFAGAMDVVVSDSSCSSGSNPYCFLQQALQALQSSVDPVDNIFLYSSSSAPVSTWGTLDATKVAKNPWSGKRLNIQPSPSSPYPVLVDGSTLPEWIFNLAPVAAAQPGMVVLSNFTIVGCPNDYGCLYASDQFMSLYFENMIFTNMLFGPYYAFAMYALTAGVYLIDTAVTDNNLGAFAYCGGDIFFIEGCTFANNIFSDYANPPAGFIVSGSTASPNTTITSSTFFNNVGPQRLIWAYGALTLQGCIFDSNTISASYEITDGHLVEADGFSNLVTPITVINCTFTNNNLGSGGGHVLFLDYHVGLVQDCVFQGNVALGMVYSTDQYAGGLTISGCTITDNYSFYGGNQPLIFIGCTVSTVLVIDDCIIIANQAGVIQEAIPVCNRLIVTNSFIWGNLDTAYVAYSGFIAEFNKTSIHNNAAALYGVPWADLICAGGQIFVAGINICAPFPWANFTSRAYPCPQGYDLCTVCGGENACLDCNNIPFGTATLAQCAAENHIPPLIQTAVGLTTNGTNPKGSVQLANYSAVYSPAELLPGFTPATLNLRLSSITTIIGGNTTVFSLDVHDYERVANFNNTSGIRCLAYQKFIVDTSLLEVTQCLYTQDTVVSFGGVSFIVTGATIKLSVGLRGFFGLTNKDFVSIDLDWALGGEYGQILAVIDGPAPGQIVSNATTGFVIKTLKTDIVYVQQSFLDFALFDGTPSTSQFQLSIAALNQSSTGETVTLQFQGPFHAVQYDPDFSLVLNTGVSSSSDGGGSNLGVILPAVLVPVAALAVVVVIGIGVVSAVVGKWYWNRQHLAHAKTTSTVNL